MKLYFYSTHGHDRNYAYKNQGKPTLTIENIDRIDIENSGECFSCKFSSAEDVEKAKILIDNFNDSGDLNPFNISKTGYVSDGIKHTGLSLRHNGRHFRIAD